MRIKSLLVYAFLITVLLPGSAISHTGHGGTWMSGFLHHVYGHPYFIAGAFVCAALISGSGIAGLVFRRIRK